MERRSLLKSLLAAPLAALFGTAKSQASESNGPSDLRPIPRAQTCGWIDEGIARTARNTTIFGLTPKEEPAWVANRETLPVAEVAEKYGISPIVAVAEPYAELQRQLEALPSVGAGNTFTMNDDVKFYGEYRVPVAERLAAPDVFHCDEQVTKPEFRYRIVRNTSAVGHAKLMQLLQKHERIVYSGRPSATWKVNYKRQA